MINNSNNNKKKKKKKNTNGGGWANCGKPWGGNPCGGKLPWLLLKFILCYISIIY